ncbi:hypothetical protein LAG90_10135 [Marinilongibacter aquaticus]|uniref:hypothetical protein n=1 Tax=Marinilongibacter aquaticus TaxID=2975157 RepID=UPI0021BDDD4C|nr:hypothetical protein [Marinilongibacter aquaticus]UBM57179.1 hypothetical protein LAG90_10135 [Marinilongibacter aquaticus]
MKSNSEKSVAILVVMLSLGSAWAIRGHFGHEWGAAWAGAIGVLALLLASGRKDWLQNWPILAATAALAWGATGMISYGQVVGYGNSADFLNAGYGLLGLFVIGGLFGFLGGGLTAMLLETSRSKKVDWASLLSQMVAGGYLIWGILIYQFEWLMTPPRSELWAACLGASGALAWYMKREHFHRAWLVAFYTMLGAGFGFTFGNFLQIMGRASGLSFNWWNVMEYSIGFFGGLGLSFSVFSQEWEEMPKLKASNGIWAVFLLAVFIPFVTILNAFTDKKMRRVAEEIGLVDVQSFESGQWLMLVCVSVWALVFIFRQYLKTKSGQISEKGVFVVFAAFWIWYYALRAISSGTFWAYHFTSDDLVIPNFILVFTLLLKRNEANPFRLKDNLASKLRPTVVFALLLLIVLAFLASQSPKTNHKENRRFKIENS